MLDLPHARTLFLGFYEPLLRRSRPFGDVVLPGQRASHLMHVTDLVWIQHMLGGIELAEAERDAWAERIQRDQEPEAGLFRYPPGTSHIDEHATWQSVAALNMLRRRPRHRLRCLEPLVTVEGFRTWCRAYRPGTSHHRFFLAVLTAASAPVSEAWRAVYGEWYDARQDPETGLPCAANSPHCLSPAFLLTVMRWAFCGSVPRPGRIVRTVLGFQCPSGAFIDADLPGYMEMDAAFLLHLLGPGVPEQADAIQAALARLGGSLDRTLADAARRERLLADPHRALAACGTLSVLWRHLGLAEAPFPWAELHHYRAPL